MDIWELPDSTFPDATVAPAVLFARKRTVVDRRTLVSVRTVQKAHLKAFRKDGVFTATAAIPAEEVWTEMPDERSGRTVTHRLRYNLVLPRSAWTALQARCVPLQERAVIFPGCTEATDPKRMRESDLQPYDVKFLRSFRSTVPAPLHVVYDHATVRTYPTDFEEPRLKFRSLMGDTKVIINSVTNPSWGLRIKAAIERAGYYISGSFWGLVPSDAGRAAGVNHEVLAAVLSWYVANGWMAGFLRHTKLPKPEIDRIPFPADLSPATVSGLTNSVLVVESEPVNSAAAVDAWATIDRALQEAYGISDSVLERLRTVARFSGKKGPPPPQLAMPDSPWLVEGVVEEVSAEDGILTIWLNDFDGVHHIPIQPHMPAWLLREGVPFRTSVSDAAWRAGDLAVDPRLGQFSIAPYSYLSDEEVLDHLAAAASRNGE
jgi:hypothetical protein